jgi:hypothetical protein
VAQSLPPLAGRLLIHAGDHKSGSTAIQEGLVRGDVTLAEGTIAFPLRDGQLNHNGAVARLQKPAPSGFGRRVLDRLTGASQRNEAFAKFARRARRLQADLTVMSAENLESVDPARLQAALAHHLPTAPGQITIVTYLRPHIPRAVSNLAEMIKIGRASQNPWHRQEIARKRRLYAPRLDAWRAVFGVAYRVRPTIRSELAGGAVLNDLMTTALGPGAATVTHNRTSNVSLGVEDLMRLHVIHRSLPQLDKVSHHALGWHLADNMELLRASGGPSTPLCADKGLAERLRSALKDDAAAVDDAWFDGKPLMRDALDHAVDSAVANKIPLDPSAWLDAAEVAALRARAPEFAALVADNAARAQLRAARIARILQDDLGRL